MPTKTQTTPLEAVHEAVLQQRATIEELEKKAEAARLEHVRAAADALQKGKDAPPLATSATREELQQARDVLQELERRHRAAVADAFHAEGLIKEQARAAAIAEQERLKKASEEPRALLYKIQAAHDLLHNAVAPVYPRSALGRGLDGTIDELRDALRTDPLCTITEAALESAIAEAEAEVKAQRHLLGDVRPDRLRIGYNGLTGEQTKVEVITTTTSDVVIETPGTAPGRHPHMMAAAPSVPKV